MKNEIIEEELNKSEEILREALDNSYEGANEYKLAFILDVVSEAYRELSRLFASRSPSVQREEVLRSTLNAVYQEAVAEECDTIANIVRQAYKDLSRLAEVGKVA